MGIKSISYRDWEQSEEEWTILDWKTDGEDWLKAIANEVIGFGLEVEVVVQHFGDYYKWRIVVIKE